MQEHGLRCDGILNICVANFISFLAIKNLKNRLRFDEVTGSFKVGTIFETQCICTAYGGHMAK